MLLEDCVEKPVVVEAQVEPILALLKDLTGITIPLQKKTMVLFRLRRRLAELSHPSLEAYTSRVRKDLKEQQLFINMLTTNETSFFRTPRIWEYFSTQFLPEFRALHGTDTLRAWSAAASTGEEACSIAMSCFEFQLRYPTFRYQILATDVDTNVLAQAASGVFQARTIEKLRTGRPDIFQRHFKPAHDGACTVDSQVMKHINFTSHNLMQRWKSPLSQDIVFLRNVLIYFREPEQQRILENLGTAMAPGSTLIIGESESISALDTCFTFVLPQIYRKRT